MRLLFTSFHSSLQENVKHQDSNFIRVLMELILKNCIEKLADGSHKLEKDRMDFAASLLTQYVEKNKEKQIDCLKVTHRFMNELEHPQSILHDILSCLYENFALSKNAFFKWHDDNDPLEQEGKGNSQSFNSKQLSNHLIIIKKNSLGVALRSIQPFIQFLKSEKDENDDDSTEEEN